MQETKDSKLTPGEREILEYIVERYSNYTNDVTSNATVDSWVASAVDKLENDERT